ncbi:uncharacterized protein IL334_005945 [Kwoniella shivajii]|uniref:Uncharacterized protein n=1 Tax=Kwoniella shivajii TaxID=564305 RepID=A0ABZ1D4J1_9TREE|nr:hypothetical protein IL334_005945 [Kwoniella shivajii]
MTHQPTSTSTAYNPAPSTLSNESQEDVPPSIVAAGTALPSAPTQPVEPQQAATAPGTGGVVEDTSGQEKISFKDQVNGYAKKFAGTVFRNEGEKDFGEKKLDGEA